MDRRKKLSSGLLIGFIFMLFDTVSHIILIVSSAEAHRYISTVFGALMAAVTFVITLGLGVTVIASFKKDSEEYTALHETENV